MSRNYCIICCCVCFMKILLIFDKSFEIICESKRRLKVLLIIFSIITAFEHKNSVQIVFCWFWTRIWFVFIDHFSNVHNLLICWNIFVFSLSLKTPLPFDLTPLTLTNTLETMFSLCFMNFIQHILDVKTSVLAINMFFNERHLFYLQF